MIVMSLYLYARTSKCVGSKRANNRPVVEFFSAVEGMGLHESRKSYLKMAMVSTLKRFNIVVESPQHFSMSLMKWKI